MRDRPGITVAEAAQPIGIGPNNLYRIPATLEREGTLSRGERGFVAPGTGGPAAPEQPDKEALPPTGATFSPPESGT